jgi:hypothetical protein
MSTMSARKKRGAGSSSLTSLAMLVVPTLERSSLEVARSPTYTTGCTLALNLSGGAGETDTEVT